MLARSTRRLTVDQFLKLYEGTEGRYELVDGEVFAMAGGSLRHARVAKNITVALDRQLSGTGCQPLRSDMGLRIDQAKLRYPDVAIYCDPRDLGGDDDTVQALSFPKVIFEVLSRSTAGEDRGIKVAEYKTLDTLQAIVLVDPAAQTIELHERLAPNEWRHLLLPPESGVSLRDPALTLAFAEIFAAD